MTGSRAPAPMTPPASGDPDESRLGREISAGPGDGSLSRLDAVKDEQIRQWSVVTPSATVIGRAERPEHDLSESVRRLHDEQHPAMRGHSARMHRLEKARITHAYCNALSLTSWERDRALGIMTELDLTAFGSQRAIEKVALVVIRHVVDDERKRRLGLHDAASLGDLTPDEMESLYERFDSLADDPTFGKLLATQDLDTTSLNRLGRTLRKQLDAQDLHGAVLGRSPYRDPSLPAIRDRSDDGEASDEDLSDGAG